MKFVKRSVSLLLVFVLLLGMVPAFAMAAGSLPFRDVTAADWFYDEVCYVYENGIMNGTGETVFSPHAPTTRGMIVTILHRLEGQPFAAASSFADVSDDRYYAQAVAWASEHGIVEGYGNGTFGPDNNITREQLATILYRYAQFCGEDTKGRKMLDDYTDANCVSAYAIDAMQWAYQKGIIEGSNGTLDPQAFATRAQVAAVMMRLTKKSSGSFPVVFPSVSHPEPDVEDDFDPKTDADRYISPTLYVSNSDDEYIHFDEESGLTYYSNELIIYAVVGTDKAKIQSLVAKDDGTIVGMSGYTDSYQIRFPESLTKQELDNLKADYEASPYVDFVFFNLALDMETNSNIPNTKRWPSSFWEGDTFTMNNGNWGTRAIKAHTAWTSFGDHMQPVRVGVFDKGFDVTHPELKDVVKASSLAETDKEDINHGTHVAGTIAAKHDGTGICGVCPTAELYVIDTASAEERRTSSYADAFAYSYLLGENQCKVVNESMGHSLLCHGVSKGDDASLDLMAALVAMMKVELTRLEAQNKNFIICVSAGNENESVFYPSDETDYGYYEKCEKHSHVISHYIDIDDEDKCKPCTKEMRDAAEIGGNDAVFNSALAAIFESDHLSDRIIVVGACTIENGEYTQSDFSNRGARVDVMAPGEDIESCISNNKYEKYPGTSMASPHVAGVAAMMFALDPDISAERVKEIIVETANIDVAGTDKKMVNAERACVKVVQEKVEESMLGIVVDVATEKPLKNVEVSIYTVRGDHSTLVASTKTSEIGRFVLEAPRYHTYWIEISGCGYEASFYHSGNTDLGTIYVSSTFTSITGKVVHAVTGEPLPEVRIQLLTEYGNYNTLVAKTQTDESGRFTLEAPVGVEYWIDFYVSDEHRNHDYFKHMGNTDLGTICIGSNTALILRKTDGTPIKLKDGTEVTAIAYEAIVSGEKAIVVDPTDVSGSAHVSQIIDTQLGRDGIIVPVSIRSVLRGPILLGYTEENIPVWRLGWTVRPDDFVLTNAEDPDFSISDNILTWNEGDSTVQQWESIQLSENAKIWIVRPENGEWIEELVPAEEFDAYREQYSLEPYPGYAWVVNDVVSGTGDDEYDYCYFVMIPVA